ncbi:hypothetical protein A2483_04765 [Candidatus Peregrinibacteria bacterium RIFOXYC2_FULL_33_13]|nr:MAG: hypothetical protein UR27_C0009G0029 [Candidatus Peregrinibacteria bacterium GW2011_GWA2_33_10]KKP41295.1 MAG: hypothetical protein UR30_C0001G0142 [Candidatus Peregrinibacteria bacterium GW2011_GWC2_33_13]OGJ49115.1 MAG: hypothetical protein A2229_01880 [Candidatus Peregrinibacteria bacterium RIFOXYA2_FULL_33_7]OGJ52758.1 MAG: hypothetical protein A2483_04765 [Candidatus Peregrinibacteria bacterium RIFOXYC2_FULL_33_13]
MLKILFSDIDGTIAHYPKHFSTFGEILSEDESSMKAVYLDKITFKKRVCNILKSATSGNAYVSLKTINLIEQLKQKGVIFVMISGVRKSTFFERIPFLPKADVWIMENGGRIYVNEILDKKWNQRFFEVTGDIETDLPPEKRIGILWDFYRELIGRGWVIDTNSYSANFRISLKQNPDKMQEDIDKLQKEVPPLITTAHNLGKADFYPEISGKGNAVKYILEKFNIRIEESAACMDDDNDLPMTSAVGKVYLPGITSESVREALKRHSDWVVSKNKGILGTEEVLEKILNEL